MVHFEVERAVDKVQEIAGCLLKGESLKALFEGPPKLIGRIQKLYCMFNIPTQEEEASRVASETLKDEMRKVVEDKLVDCKISSILTQVPSYRIPYFKSAVEGFYSKFVAEGLPHEEALPLSIARGLIRLMIDLYDEDSDSEEEDCIMDSDNELMKQLEADPDLKDYQCFISLDRLLLDAVYLEGNSLIRYHKRHIEKWIEEKGTDPITGEPKTLEDLEPDYKARGIVENKLLSLLFPDVFGGITCSKKVEDLESKALLLAISAAYPLVKAVFTITAEKTKDRNQMLKEVEAYAQRVFSEFFSIAEYLSVEGKEVPPSVEEFIAKLKAFIPFAYKIEEAGMATRIQEELFEMGEEAIRKGTSYEDALGIVEAYFRPIREEEQIRALYPNTLIGAEEWSSLGFVESTPIPEGTLEVLKRPSVGIEGQTEGAKIGDTHVLVLIPGEVDGVSLTINSLGMLLKNKGYFRNTKAGFLYVSKGVVREHGETRAHPHWVLISRNILSGSRVKIYADQHRDLERLAENTGLAYQVPSLFEAVVCNFMVYITSNANRTRLFADAPSTYTSCEEVIKGYRVVVGGFSSCGLNIHTSEHNEAVGIATALREFRVAPY